MYFTKEGYDDFYYGKGSTYPDINGGVGILFEQARYAPKLPSALLNVPIINSILSLSPSSSTTPEPFSPNKKFPTKPFWIILKNSEFLRKPVLI